MKKLLSLLAGLAMTATTATTVVSCSWGCSSDKKPAVKVNFDDAGNVSADFEATLGQDIKTPGDVKKSFKVYDKNGNPIPDAKVEIVPANTPTPLEKGKTYKFKVTYNIDPYDGTKDQIFDVKEVDNRAKIDDGNGGETDNTKFGQPLDNGATVEIKVPKNNKLSPDYGNVDGTVTMNDPKNGAQPVGVSDGKGNFLGKDGEKEVSVNNSGYLVDTTGDKKNNPGYGKRIAGLDDNSKPLTDKEGTIYLDNDGYRIKHYDDKSAAEAGLTPGWHRVSNDGQYPMGPDTGKTAYEVNSGKETGVDPVPSNVSTDVAKYVKRDTNGNIIAYLNDKGQIIDPNAEKDGQPNPNFGKPINGDSTPIEKSMPPYAAKDKDGKEIGTGKYVESAEKTYDKETTNRYSLDGSAQIKLGSDAKKGSVIIGDGGVDGIANGTSVALNPSEASSQEWTTIPNGKYAGMQVKIDGNEVKFRWPVSDKQIDDIISGSDQKNSSPSKDSPLDENGKINLPIEYTTGKDGSGKKINKIDQKVNITTPWDADKNSDANVDSSMRWWIDPNATKEAIKYDKDSTTLRVFLSTALVNKMEDPTLNPWTDNDLLLNGPKLSDPDLKISLNGVDAYKKSSIDDVLQKSEDGLYFVEYEISAKEDLQFEENKDITLSFTDKDSTFISGAQAVKDTPSSIKIQLSAISRTITFKSTETKTNNLNVSKFEIDDSKLPTDIDWDQSPKVEFKERAPKALSDEQPTDNGWKDIKDLVDLSKGDIFNKKDKTITLNFKDGVLDKTKYDIQTTFFVKDDKEGKFSSVNKLVVDKDEASDNEKAISIADSNIQTTFNGRDAKWTGFTTSEGTLINKEKTPDVKLNIASNSYTMLTESVKADDVKWNGNDLEFTLSDEIPERGRVYSATVTFEMDKGFGSVTMNQTLKVSVDDNKSIDWTSGQRNQLTFGRQDFAAFDIKTKDSKFKADQIDQDKTKIIYKGNYPLDTKKDLSYSYDDKQVKITLNKEIPFQDKKLDFIVSLVDKEGNALNPEIVSIAKDEAMASHSSVEWTSAEEKFNDTTATVEFNIKNKSLCEDVDFTSFDDKSVKLVSENTNVGGEYTLPENYYNAHFEGEKLTVTLNLPDKIADIKRGEYNFEATFKLKNGYEKAKDNTTSATLTAAKDLPLSKNAQVKVEVVGGEDHNILDNGVQYHILGPAGDPDHSAIDLTNTDAISVKLSNPDYDGKIKYSLDKESMILSVNMAPGQEISGGKSGIEISFGFKDFDDLGYAAGKGVVGYTGEVIKKEPTPGFTNVTWNSTDRHIARDGNDVSFTLDMGAMAKNGIDIDANNAKKVSMSSDGGNSFIEMTKKDNVFTANDGTVLTYDKGTAKVSFSDEVMNKVDLHVKPRQFKVALAVGNGYENSTFATKDHPDGFDGGAILKVTKDFSTKAEREIVIDKTNEIQDFNETTDTIDGIGWHKGTWHVSKVSSEIDLNNLSSIKFTNKDTKYQPPLDPDTTEIEVPDSDGKEPTPVTKGRTKAETLNDPKKLDGTKIPSRYKWEAKTNDDGSADISVYIMDGALWYGTEYDIDLVFKLKNYNETVTGPTLKFSKTKANKNESYVQTVSGTYYTNTWVTTSKTVAWAKLHPNKYYAETSVRFSAFGSAVDPNSIHVQVLNDAVSAGKVYYFGTERKGSEIIVTFRCWQWKVVDNMGKGSKAPKFKLTFDLSTFEGQTTTADIVIDYGGKDYKTSVID